MGIEQYCTPPRKVDRVINPKELELQETICKQAEEIARLRKEVENLSKGNDHIVKFVKVEEYERKFLVNPIYHDEIKSSSSSHTSRVQGYLDISRNPFFSEVRVAKRSDRNYGVVTIKTIRIDDHRTEFHFHIPSKDALDLLAMCQYRVAKNRYFVVVDGIQWEVDFFTNENAGLVIAELEFADEESMDNFTKTYKLPHWVEKEVTNDPRFYNYSLAMYPWITWKDDRMKGGVAKWLEKLFH